MVLHLCDDSRKWKHCSNAPSMTKVVERYSTVYDTFPYYEWQNHYLPSSMYVLSFSARHMRTVRKWFSFETLEFTQWSIILSWEVYTLFVRPARRNTLMSWTSYFTMIFGALTIFWLFALNLSISDSCKKVFQKLLGSFRLESSQANRYILDIYN